MVAERGFIFHQTILLKLRRKSIDKDKVQPLTKSNSQATKVLFLGSAVLGAVFCYVTKSSSLDSQKVIQAVWLGRLLIAIGVIGWLLVDEVSIALDDKKKVLRIRRQNYLRDSSSFVPLDQIENVRSLRMGSGKGPAAYQVVIELKNSNQINTGRWSFNQAEIIGEAESLSHILESEVKTGLIVHPVNADIAIAGYKVNQMILAVAISVAIYAVWFRYQVGPWCPAMWHGTAPVFIIALSFAACMGILRRLPRQ